MNENLFVYRQFLYVQEYKIHDMKYMNIAMLTLLGSHSNKYKYVLIVD